MKKANQIGYEFPEKMWYQTVMLKSLAFHILSIPMFLHEDLLRILYIVDDIP